MPEPIHYTSRDTEAAHRVIIELGQVLASYRDKFVVIGGSVPALVFQETHPEHIGTVDVDLALNASALADNQQYASLVEALENKGYVRGEKFGLKSFQLAREVSLQDGGAPVRILVDLLKPKGRWRGTTPARLEKFRPIDAEGANVALHNFDEKRLHGVMPNGAENDVTLRVATIPALLVMKGYALELRAKDKDAYDVWYCLLQDPEGVARACAALIAPGAPDEAEARQGLTYLVSKFRTRDYVGPVAVRDFLIEQSALGDRTPEQVQTDAFLRVQVFAKVLKI